MVFLLGTVPNYTNSLNSFFKRAFKYGYVKSTITVEEL